MNDHTITPLHSSRTPAPSIIESDLYMRFLDYHRRSPKTAETYRYALKRFMQWCRDTGITRPQREDIIGYLDYLEQDVKAAPGTITSYMAAIRLFFRWLVDEGLYERDITADIKGPKVSRRHKKDYLQPDQAAALLAVPDTDTERGCRDRAILAVMIFCGLRTVEITRLDLDDVTSYAGQPALMVWGKGETAGNREPVHILPQVLEMLETYIKAYRGDAGPHDPLFVGTSNNGKGQRMSTRSVSQMVKDTMRRIGLESSRLTAHSTRHTAVTLALKGGCTLQEAQQMARHKRIETTMIYAHNLEWEANTAQQGLWNYIYKDK